MTVPEGWKVHRISEIADIHVGKDLQKNRFSDVQTEKHIYPVYSNSLTNKGLYGYYDFEEYNGNCLTVVGRGVLGTAFARISGFGAIGRLLVIAPDSRILFDVSYLAEYINHQLTIYNESTGVPQLPGESFGKYEVVLPPLPEQKKIAAILTSVDDAIQATRETIEQTKRVKKGLMQELLTKGIGHTRFRTLENGMTVPEDWKLSELGQVVSIDTGFAFKSKDFVTSGGYPIVRMSNLAQGHLALSDAARITERTARESMHYRLEPNDFLVGLSGSIGNYAWVSEDDEECYLNQRVGRIKAKDKMIAHFIAQWYLSQPTQDMIASLAAGAAQLNVSPKQLAGLEVALPPSLELRKIADILTSVDARAQIEEEKVQELEQVKRGLMQDLLTGRVRVAV